MIAPRFHLEKPALCPNTHVCKSSHTGFLVLSLPVTQVPVSYTPSMTLRERVWEEFAADLEYHPKRALLYVGLSVAAFAVWFWYPSGDREAVVPLIAVLGGIALVLKGVFLFRRSSEGLALTHQELEELSHPANRKSLPPIPILAAQIVQDFGVGALVLAPILHSLRHANQSRQFPTAQVFFAGAVFVATGWSIRHLVRSENRRQ